MKLRRTYVLYCRKNQTMWFFTGIEPNAFASGFSPLKNKTFSLVFSAESSSPPFIIRTEKALFCVFEQSATKMHKIQNYKMSSRIYFGILPVGKRNFKLARCCASQEQALYCSLRSSPEFFVQIDLYG